MKFLTSGMSVFGPSSLRPHPNHGRKFIVFFSSSRSFLTARRSKGKGCLAASRHRLFLYWPVSKCAFGREGRSPDLLLPGWAETVRHSWSGVGEEVAEGW